MENNKLCACYFGENSNISIVSLCYSLAQNHTNIVNVKHLLTVVVILNSIWNNKMFTDKLDFLELNKKDVIQ